LDPDISSASIGTSWYAGFATAAAAILAILNALWPRKKSATSFGLDYSVSSLQCNHIKWYVLDLMHEYWKDDPPQPVHELIIHPIWCMVLCVDQQSDPMPKWTSWPCHSKVSPQLTSVTMNLPTFVQRHIPITLWPTQWPVKYEHKRDAIFHHLRIVGVLRMIRFAGNTRRCKVYSTWMADMSRSTLKSMVRQPVLSRAILDIPGVHSNRKCCWWVCPAYIFDEMNPLAIVR
jgi:hypothetical protein